jgi:integrase
MSARRGRGEGSVFRRGDGRWCGVMDLGWVEGRRSRKFVYGKTRKETRERLMAAQAAFRSGLSPAPERLTVGEYLVEWLAAARPTIRASTFASYEAIVRVHLIPSLGRFPLNKLAVTDVERLLRSKSASGLSPRRVAMIRGTLRRALNRAVKHRFVPDNVAALADPPKAERHQINPLSPEQARVLLASIAGHRLEALFVTALTTGLRSGELRALRWDDLDLDARCLSVEASLTRIDGRWERVPPKSDAGRRMVPLTDRTVAALRDHRARQLRERMASGTGWIGTPWNLVFVSELGTPLDGSNVVHAYQRELRRAGLPRQRFHDARHSVATFWLACGVPARVVADMLGHSQVSLTLNVYTHVLPTLRRDAADRLDLLLEGG